MTGVPICKLPMSLFKNYEPNSPLCGVLKACLQYKHNKRWMAPDFLLDLPAQQFFDMLQFMRADLLVRGGSMRVCVGVCVRV
jgi:hypothetical protein